MYLEEINGKTKTNKPYTGFILHVGEYTSTMFFPSKVEAMYIKDYIKNKSHEDFKGDDLDVDTDSIS